MLADHDPCDRHYSILFVEHHQSEVKDYRVSRRSLLMFEAILRSSVEDKASVAGEPAA